jgi:hypothetical protein
MASPLEIMEGRVIAHKLADLKKTNHSH